MLVVKVFGAKDIGEESPRFARGPSHVLSDRMLAEPGPRRFGPGAARGCAPVASTCGDLHVAGGRPHAPGRVVPRPRPTVSTLDQPSPILPPLPSFPTGGIPKVSCISALSRTRIAWQCSSLN